MNKTETLSVSVVGILQLPYMLKDRTVVDQRCSMSTAFLCGGGVAGVSFSLGTKEISLRAMLQTNNGTTWS